MKNKKNGGYITLSDKGLEIAEKMSERHNLLSTWLISLRINPECR